MKKVISPTVFILLLASISLFAVSCKKSKNTEPSADSFVQFKLDGVQQKFTVSSVLQNAISSGYLDLICSQTSDTAINSLEIRVISDSPIDNEEYAYPFTSLLFKDGSSKQYYSYSAVPTTLTLTSITNDRIKGVFSGGIKDGTGHTMSVTDGTLDIALR